MMNFKTLGSWEAEDPLDSAQWCPYPEYQHIVAVGSYRYIDELKDRNGEIILLDVSNPEGINVLTSEKKFGILDCQWNPNVKFLQLATAQANGSINVFSFPHLKLISKIDLANEEEIIALSVDWNVSGDALAVSDSKGGLSIINRRETNFELERTWPKAHGFEAWVASWDKINPSILYSGGDDCRLNIWDIRSENSYKPIGVIKNLHKAGVTAISSESQDSNYIATGSYDEWLHILDRRKLSSSSILNQAISAHPVSSINVNGGIWRIRWNSSFNEKLIAIASMGAGFQVLKYTPDGNIEKIAEIASDIHYGGLAYGIDWGPNNRLVTSSFQNKKLSVSEISPL